MLSSQIAVFIIVVLLCVGSITGKSFGGGGGGGYRKGGPSRSKGNNENNDNNDNQSQSQGSNSNQGRGSQSNEQGVRSNSNMEGGTRYVMWGRTVCEEDAEVVYEGFAGSGAHGTNGGLSNLICLINTPKHKSILKLGNNGKAGKIYRVKYSFENSPFVITNNYGATFLEQDMTCVVCRIPRSSVVPVYGTDYCPDGLTMEYWGYLVSSINEQSRQDYTCLHNAPESIVGAESQMPNSYVSPVQVIVPTLKLQSIAPYMKGYGVTCVICST